MLPCSHCVTPSMFAKTHCLSLQSRPFTNTYTIKTVCTTVSSCYDNKSLVCLVNEAEQMLALPCGNTTKPSLSLSSLLFRELEQNINLNIDLENV